MAHGGAAIMAHGGAAVCSGQPQREQVSHGACPAGPVVASSGVAAADPSAGLRAAEPVEASGPADVVAAEAVAAGRATEECSAEIARRADEVATPGNYMGLFEWLVFAALFRQRVMLLIGPDRKDVCSWVGASVRDIQDLPRHRHGWLAVACYGTTLEAHIDEHSVLRMNHWVVGVPTGAGIDVAADAAAREAPGLNPNPHYLIRACQAAGFNWRPTLINGDCVMTRWRSCCTAPPPC